MMAREELISSPAPRAFKPAASVASRSPPCAPIPGTRNDSCRVRAAQFGHFAVDRSRPTTSIKFRCWFQRAAARSATQPVQGQAVDEQILEIPGAGIRGAAQQNRAAVGPGEKGQHRVLAHVGIDGDGVGAVALEGLARVGLGGIADVAALRVEDHQRGGRALADVADARGELVLSAQRAVERDLRLVGGGDIGCRIDDAPVEGEQRLRVGAQIRGQFDRGPDRGRRTASRWWRFALGASRSANIMGMRAMITTRIGSMLRA